MRILVAVDLSKDSAALVRYAAGISARTGGELVILHVYAREEAVTALRDEGLFVDIYVSRLRSELRYLQAQAGTAGQKARVEVITGDPVSQITTRAHELEVDLIVMGTHGRTGLPRLLMGSVAEGVLRQATCPVLLAPVRILAGQPRERAAVSAG
ncbi:MAG TPA: universal stress protein [bacterium]|nr:universal stress protein [bacterium]